MAAGVPFLGRVTRPTHVLWLNSEPGVQSGAELIARISQHLGITRPPHFSIWTPTESASAASYAALKWSEIAGDHEKLLLVDPLANYNPDAEDKSSKAAIQINEWRKMARHNTSVIFSHHLRKPGDDATEGQRLDLEDVVDLHSWFKDARGAGALVANSDIRLGIEGHSTDDTVSIRGFERGAGEIGPIVLKRAVDMAIGCPIGYEPISDRPEQLQRVFTVNTEARVVFETLPQQFTFKQFHLALGKGGSSTARWLRRAQDGGLLRKLPENGGYEKL